MACASPHPRLSPPSFFMRSNMWSSTTVINQLLHSRKANVPAHGELLAQRITASAPVLHGCSFVAQCTSSKVPLPIEDRFESLRLQFGEHLSSEVAEKHAIHGSKYVG
eukprot:1148205-Pelagomonas_calceolata.AAC.2